jgi:hypothetical protein
VKDCENCLTQKKICGFGIPATGSTDWKRITEIQPFTFDERDQIFLKNKEENIKKVRLNYLWVNFIFKVKYFVMNSQTAVLCI